MINVPHFFSDGALFQADSQFELSGVCNPVTGVVCTIFDKADTPVFSAETLSDAEGKFSLCVKTSPASFDEYKISLVCGNEEKTIAGVMFGEVWLASGQSNMELQNAFIVGHEQLFDEIRDKKIRVFHVDYPPEWGAFAFPYEPDTAVHGYWISAGEDEKLMNVSAAGLKFAAEIYAHLNERKDVPVGILNASWGGTGINAWIPKEYIDGDARVSSALREYGSYPDKESWNTKGDLNFQQSCCQFNYKIAPLTGLKFRGVIWYQGEHECWSEFSHKIYADYLRLYHRAYREMFAADETFMMLSTLIYPWAYTGDSDCFLGHLNSAFVETAVESPDKFAFVPIGDLEPVWSYHRGNHPIHPTHKYEVGRRLARLAIGNVYGGDAQKSPAYLTEWRAEGNKMTLKFASVGNGLYVGDKNPKRRAHCLYAAGEDNLYLPAEYRIISSDTLEVWCDGIDEIKNVCYAFQSLDIKCNIFAGEYPVAPFATDMKTLLTIETHRWYDSSESLCWTNHIHDDVLDMFYHPMWKPLENSEVCHDTAFCFDTTASVRVCSDEKTFGCYLSSSPYNRLDLFNYTAVEADFYNAGKTAPSLRLISENGAETVIPFVKIGGEREGWARYSASLKGIPAGYTKKMIFSFEDEKNDYHFVNIERVRLITK